MSIKFQQCISRQDKLYYTDRQAGREEGVHTHSHAYICTNAAINGQIKSGTTRMLNNSGSSSFKFIEECKKRKQCIFSSRGVYALGDI